MSAERYKVIANDLERRINANEFSERIPGMRALVTEYKSSLRTISRVIDVLRIRGLITSRPGVGNYLKKRS